MVSVAATVAAAPFFPRYQFTDILGNCSRLLSGKLHVVALHACPSANDLIYRITNIKRGTTVKAVVFRAPTLTLRRYGFPIYIEMIWL